jgi:hypothetical protein
MNQKLNKKSRNRRKSSKKISRRKKYSTKKHKKCKKCYRGGMMNENQPPLEECSFCFSEINIQDDGIIFRNLFQCAHDFHKECIINWINTKKIENTLFVENEEGDFVNSMTCPLCRAELSNNGNQTVDTVDRILDMNDRSTRRNMFRDLLQYDYPYDANEDSFFRLYIFPIPRITYDYVRDSVRYELSNEFAVRSAGIYFFLSFVITGNDGRQTLTRYYSNFRTLQFFRGIFNILAVIALPYDNEHISLRINAVTNIFVTFIVLNLDNIFTNAPTEINTVNGRISMVDIIATLINMFARFIVNNADFENYNYYFQNRQLGGVSNTTSSIKSNQNIKFKFTSMEDVKDFLDVVDKNKTKLESLLEKVPFTLSAFFPKIEYSRELVQKLRPLIKN